MHLAPVYRMRIVLRTLLVIAVLAAVFPFLATSLLLDWKGVPLQGHVMSKDEWITVGYSSWLRHAQVQIKYDPPDGSGSLAILNAEPAQEQFDLLRPGDPVPLRYLLAKDLPAWPGIQILRQMHLLPVVRLASQETGSRLRSAFERAHSALVAFLLAALILLAWRLFRLPFFAGAVALCVAGAIIWSLFASFPVPTRGPTNNVHTATGTVKSVEVWKQLFESNQSRGPNHWMAAQPIAVIGVKFLPEGRSEPVLAVDLIDQGSLPGLAEASQVTLNYELANPRIAQIRGARRDFASRNFTGLLTQALELLLVSAVLLTAAHLFGVFYKRLGRPKRP